MACHPGYCGRHAAGARHHQADDKLDRGVCFGQPGAARHRVVNPARLCGFLSGDVGAVCIILGLFTRAFALAIGIQFLIITFHAHWAQGFAWNRPGGGWEYPLFWGMSWVAIGLRGGGPYSLDRLLGREL
jgi:putative oxidoreductase